MNAVNILVRLLVLKSLLTAGGTSESVKQLNQPATMHHGQYNSFESHYAENSGHRHGASHVCSEKKRFGTVPRQDRMASFRKNRGFPPEMWPATWTCFHMALPMVNLCFGPVPQSLYCSLPPPVSRVNSRNNHQWRPRMIRLQRSPGGTKGYPLPIIYMSSWL